MVLQEGPQGTQEQLFKVVGRPIVDNVLQGYNSTIFVSCCSWQGWGLGLLLLPCFSSAPQVFFAERDASTFCPWGTPAGVWPDGER